MNLWLDVIYQYICSFIILGVWLSNLGIWLNDVPFCFLNKFKLIHNPPYQNKFWTSVQLVSVINEK